MVGVILACHSSGNIIEDVAHIALRITVKGICQRIHNRGFVFLPQLPKERATCVAPPVLGVRYIKYIFQPGLIGGGVNQGDALGAALYPSVHGFVPCFDGRTRHRVGPLGMNHQLFGVRVFIKPSRCFQKGSPAFPALRYLTACVFGQLRIEL
ncbi:hypothetical protein LJC33_00650 [Eubacteriales bacterium OttesenSCG-928-N13]|nr:hypothetical protein [Eubacteriales bacterium OttesenSCG-928-N13]